MITLRVDGEPAPQGSKSVGRHGGVYEKSRKVGPWRAAIRAAAMRAGVRPLAGPVAVEILFLLPRPAGHYRAGRYGHLLRDSAPAVPATRPDWDKLIRSTMDGLKEGGAYGDDGQVVDGLVRKRYADRGSPPGALISLWEWTP